MKSTEAKNPPMGSQSHELYTVGNGTEVDKQHTEITVRRCTVASEKRKEEKYLGICFITLNALLSSFSCKTCPNPIK